MTDRHADPVFSLVHQLDRLLEEVRMVRAQTEVTGMDPARRAALEESLRTCEASIEMAVGEVMAIRAHQHDG